MSAVVVVCFIDCNVCEFLSIFCSEPAIVTAFVLFQSMVLNSVNLSKPSCNWVKSSRVYILIWDVPCIFHLLKCNKLSTATIYIYVGRRAVLVVIMADHDDCDLYEMIKVCLFMIVLKTIHALVHVCILL